MDLKKDKIDEAFDKYALSFAGKTIKQVDLKETILSPLDAPPTASKELWNARLYYNCLGTNPFYKHAPFYLNDKGSLIQVKVVDNEITLKELLTFPQLTGEQAKRRVDNPSIRFVAPHMGILADGTGELCLFGFMQGHWSILWTVSPLGDPSSLTILQAQLADDERIHCIVGNLTAKGQRVYAITIDLQAPDQITTVLLHEGGKAVRYAEFVAPNEVVFLVEDTHHLHIPIQTAPSHKRHHEPEGGPVLKAPRAGIGFTGEVLNPEIPLAPITHEELYAKPLYDRFLPSSTPYSSLDQPLHSANPSAPQHGHDIPHEIPTTDSLLGGFEECDDVDPNASAVVYLYDFIEKAVTASLPIDCRKYRFLGPSSQCGGNLLFQYDVHGLVYSVRVKPHEITLVHEHTFPAFGYVQASKTQKKFSLFHPSGSLAIIADFEKRVYLYKGNPEAGQPAHTLTSYLHELSSDQAIHGVQFTSPSTAILLTTSSVLLLSVAM